MIGVWDCIGEGYVGVGCCIAGPLSDPVLDRGSARLTGINGSLVRSLAAPSKANSLDLAEFYTVVSWYQTVVAFNSARIAFERIEFNCQRLASHNTTSPARERPQEDRYGYVDYIIKFI